MNVSAVLRDARRRRGLSVRGAAARCGVPPATWSRWESGTGAPPTSRVSDALAALSFDLVLVARSVEPAGQAVVERHLSRSLTARVRLALAHQLDATVAACRERPRQLTGPAAVGVWVPSVFARGPLPLPVASVAAAGHVAVHLTAQSHASDAIAFVPTPAMLISAGAAESWPGLTTAARLLHERGPRDAEERRLPPHRDPDEEREVRDLAPTLTWGGRGKMPVSPSDSRAWRLGGPATLDQALAAKGYPARHEPRQRGSRP